MNWMKYSVFPCSLSENQKILIESDLQVDHPSQCLRHTFMKLHFPNRTICAPKGHLVNCQEYSNPWNNPEYGLYLKFSGYQYLKFKYYIKAKMYHGMHNKLESLNSSLLSAM